VLTARVLVVAVDELLLLLLEGNGVSGWPEWSSSSNFHVGQILGGVNSEKAINLFIKIIIGYDK
jgi:hypothetical protein